MSLKQPNLKPIHGSKSGHAFYLFLYYTMHFRIIPLLSFSLTCGQNGGFFSTHYFFPLYCIPSYTKHPNTSVFPCYKQFGKKKLWETFINCGSEQEVPTNLVGELLKNYAVKIKMIRIDSCILIIVHMLCQISVSRGRCWVHFDCKRLFAAVYLVSTE